MTTTINTRLTLKEKMTKKYPEKTKYSLYRWLSISFLTIEYICLPPLPLSFNKILEAKGMMTSIGKRNSVCAVLGIEVQGFLA